MEYLFTEWCDCNLSYTFNRFLEKLYEHKRIIFGAILSIISFSCFIHWGSSDSNSQSSLIAGVVFLIFSGVWALGHLIKYCWRQRNKYKKNVTHMTYNTAPAKSRNKKWYDIV